MFAQSFSKLGRQFLEVKDNKRAQEVHQEEAWRYWAKNRQNFTGYTQRPVLTKIVKVHKA